MFKYVLVLAILPALVFGGSINFEECSRNKGPLPKSIEIEGCDESGCTIYNRVPVQMTGVLVSEMDAQELTTTLTAWLSIISLDLELPEDIVDGCNAVEGGCPVSTGEERNISAAFEVDSTFSNISPAIELTLTNEAGDIFMCVRTTVTLMNPAE